MTAAPVSATDTDPDTDTDTDTSDDTAQRPPWNAATLIAFRFGTCYFGAFGLALLVGLIPVILAGIGVEGPWSVMRGFR